MNPSDQENITQNKSFYDRKYNAQSIQPILNILDRVDDFLDGMISTEISWVGMYARDFRSILTGKTVLELGCGDCRNVAIMAKLGARVWANDISDKSGSIIEQLNAHYDFEHKIEFIKGDYSETTVKDDFFDIIIGKAFLHHLTEEHELRMMEQISRTLKPTGHARFFEPAVNSRLLDELRWAVPVPGRPSKWFQPKAFKAWEEADPHPLRDNSSTHFKKLGQGFFEKVEIIPLGIIERLDRILPFGPKTSGRFKRWSLKAENNLPKRVRRIGARSQLVLLDKKHLLEVNR